jgi:putative transcription antitermination factor YqgF
MTTYLGIDYGTRHIGLALADGPLATPLISISNEDPASAERRIIEIIDKHSVDSIIIGLPEGLLDKKVTSLGDHINELTGKPVTYHPETLSTQEAIQALRRGGARRRKLQNDHVYAACLILEDYLELRANTNKSDL